MKIHSRRVRSGFTLIELSVALGIGMTVSALVMAMFNQQLTFLRIFKAQGFLTEEAPIISTYVSKLVGKAERFSLHANFDDAKSGSNARLEESSFMVLNFRQPDGSFRRSILAFHDLETGRGPALYYYVVPSDEELDIETPDWVLTDQPDEVSFFVIPPDGEPDPGDGVLRMRLTGPNDEMITYSGTMQQ